MSDMWSSVMLRWVRCPADCDCGQLYHPAYQDCDTCRGHGFFTGGDAQQPCPRCRLRLMDLQRTYEKVAP